MKRRLSEPFGKAGLTVAILALVLALVGGAYAAGGLTKSQEKQVTKIAKKYAGKPGATGPAGAAGANGTPGANGKDGANGTSGKDGESVEVTQLSAPDCNGQGGARFTVGTEEAEACNGQTGFTETLPSGKSLMGDWSLNYSQPAEKISSARISTDVSFGIPLAVAPTVHYLKENGQETYFDEAAAEFKERFQPECLGSAEEPEAKPGNLCVYASHEAGSRPTFLTYPLPKVCGPGTTDPTTELPEVGLGCLYGAPAADRTGFTVMTVADGVSSFVELGGTWAVTAP